MCARMKKDLSWAKRTDTSMRRSPRIKRSIERQRNNGTCGETHRDMNKMPHILLGCVRVIDAVADDGPHIEAVLHGAVEVGRPPVPPLPVAAVPPLRHHFPNHCVRSERVKVCVHVRVWNWGREKGRESEKMHSALRSAVALLGHHFLDHCARKTIVEAR